MMDNEARGIDQRVLRLLEILDPKSQAILWYLWWHRHADIEEMRNLIDAPGDYEIVYRFKEVINREAEKLWGKPLVSFEQAKVDPHSGKKIMFNWWFLDDEDSPKAERGDPLVDIFSDQDGLTIIAQVPTYLDYDWPKIDYKNGVMKLRFLKRENHETGREER